MPTIFKPAEPFAEVITLKRNNYYTVQLLGCQSVLQWWFFYFNTL